MLSADEWYNVTNCWYDTDDKDFDDDVSKTYNRNKEYTYRRWWMVMSDRMWLLMWYKWVRWWWCG